jgi:hypothetical protein
MNIYLNINGKTQSDIKLRASLIENAKLNILQDE